MTVTGVRSEDEAIHWLSLCDFNLERAVDLFLNAVHQTSTDSSYIGSKRSNSALHDTALEVDGRNGYEGNDIDEVRRPDPVKWQRLLINEENAGISYL